MLESLTSMTIVTISGTALLTAAMAAVQSSSEGANILLAQGIANQLMDEIAAMRFPDGVSPAPPTGTLRALFNDLDDYAGWSARPPTDRQGCVLGTEGSSAGGVNVLRPIAVQPDASTLGSFTESVLVERVQPNSSGDWTTVTTHTGHRRVTVQVNYTDARGVTRPLATNTRIFAAVAMSP
jgi:hypothetical protein